MSGPPDYGGYPVDHNYPGHSYNTGIPWSSHPDNPNILPDPGYKPLAVETGANTRQRQMRTTSSLTRGLYNFQKYPYFLAKNTSTPTPSQRDLHLLNAWRPSTLQSYNSAVKHMVKYLRTENQWNGLPLTKEDVWDFCLEIGHTMEDLGSVGVTAATL
ncbi:hypothetical protein PCANC_12640 [Puccinia coronata f. sp. avenae]|uniref:Core-binding (CB) domain-containing protein n=1 Tax=Puccinia coronata f. sp. avenae TaxID=200324 RepID=A0A2N5T2T6_9BASI|nr:hypothetical protein PCANC_12640 [Puccinia coronata f. sp. avenae]